MTTQIEKLDFLKTQDIDADKDLYLLLNIKTCEKQSEKQLEKQSEKPLEKPLETPSIHVLNKIACKYGYIEYFETECSKCSDSDEINSEFLCLLRKKSHSYFKIASRYGKIDILQWLKQFGSTSVGKLYGLGLAYDHKSINYASRNGNIDILNWWLGSGLELVYDSRAINYASGNGHTNVLDWWLKSGLELDYNSKAINYASTNGHSNVLDWWLKIKINSKIRLEYDCDAINNASINGKEKM